MAGFKVITEGGALRDRSQVRPETHYNGEI
jgi:hypothetical protein